MLMGKCLCPMIRSCWTTLISQVLQIGQGDSWEVVPRCKLGLKDKTENGKQKNQMDIQTDTEKSESSSQGSCGYQALVSSAATAGHSLEELGVGLALFLGLLSE